MNENRLLAALPIDRGRLPPVSHCRSPGSLVRRFRHRSPARPATELSASADGPSSCQLDQQTDVIGRRGNFILGASWGGSSGLHIVRMFHQVTFVS